MKHLGLVCLGKFSNVFIQITVPGSNYCQKDYFDMKALACYNDCHIGNIITIILLSHGNQNSNSFYPLTPRVKLWVIKSLILWTTLKCSPFTGKLFSSTLLWCCVFFNLTRFVIFGTISILDLTLSGLKGLKLLGTMTTGFYVYLRANCSLPKMFVAGSILGVFIKGFVPKSLDDFRRICECFLSNSAGLGCGSKGLMRDAAAAPNDWDLTGVVSNTCARSFRSDLECLLGADL